MPYKSDAVSRRLSSVVVDDDAKTLTVDSLEDLYLFARIQPPHWRRPLLTVGDITKHKKDAQASLKTWRAIFYPQYRFRYRYAGVSAKPPTFGPEEM